MNSLLKEYIKTRKPKIENLSEKESKAYEVGLGLLATIVCEDFFNIPQLPDHKYSQNGLFYSIPYFNDDQLWTFDNQRMMVVVYEIENKSSFCPLRIDFKFDDELNFWFYVYDQSGQRTIKRELIGRENGTYYTEIEEHETIKLSELVSIKS